MRNLFIFVVLGAIATLSAAQNNPQSDRYNQGNYNDEYQNSIRQMREVASGKGNLKSYSESQLEDSEKKNPQDTVASSQDRQINAEIREKLNSGWNSQGNRSFVLYTANGVVTILGTVDSSDEIDNIIAQIKAVDGVQGVNSKLSVKR